MWTTKSRLAATAMLTIGILADTLVGQETKSVAVAEFEQLHGKLVQMSNEKVWSIPWQLSVREARELASAENKPVFLWISSNGGTHPLGPC